MEPATVVSHDGSRAAEYPLRFYINKRRVDIIRIKKRWLSPGCRCFEVLGDDSRVYLLEYNENNGIWNLLKVN